MAVSASSDAITKPLMDEREYRWLKLDNEMQVFLVSDKAADKAAASMDVSVGHASDPEELPGLAHFLEHMLFLGTEKYPDEASYSKYLASHGGFSNAFTAFENTNFHFDVMHPHLPEALDRFAQFFIAPLFTESATSRELKAIDSENAKNLQSDGWRMQQLSRWAASVDHPYHKFGTGNLETLRDVPAKLVTLRLAPSGGGRVGAAVRAESRPALSIREALFAFHKEHYSANAMRLSVLGTQSLDELQALIVPLFGAVPNTRRVPPVWGGEPYGEKQMGTLMRVVPVKELRSLQVHWAMPPIRALWRSKPHRYLSHLVGHEAEGSLLSLLKDKGLVNELCAGESVTASDFAVFSVQMTLTEEGDTRVEEIIGHVFEYLALLRSEAPKQWIFDECRDMGVMAFKFQENAEPSDLVQYAAQSLELFPPEQLLSAPNLFDSFEPEGITQMLATLTAHRAMVVHASAICAPLAPLTEAWYGTPFGISSFPPEVLSGWAAASVPPSLRLPEPNPFIPTDFDLVCDGPTFEPLQLPAALRRDDAVELWHKTDAKFRRPKALVYAHIVAPRAYACPSAVVYSSLFEKLLSDELTEFSYNAQLSGLHYRVANVSTGLRLSVSGYSHKLPVLLSKVLSRMASAELAPERFEVQRDVAVRDYMNFFKEQPYQHAVYQSNVLLEQTKWHILSYLEAATSADLSLHGLREFAASLLRRVKIRLFTHGNLAPQTAEALAADALQALGSSALPPSEVPELRLLRLPCESELWLRQHADVLSPLQRKHCNPNDTNSAVEVYLQLGEDARPTTMLVELLAQVIHKPAEQQLRTVEQLGYIVWCTVRYDVGVVGLRIIIQSSTHSPDALDARIEAFLDGVPELIDDLSEESFADYRQALLDIKEEKDHRLSEEFSRYWREVFPYGTYDFERDARDAEVVKTLTKQQLTQLWSTHFARESPQRRKLSSQVFAAQHELPPAQQQPANVRCVDGVEALLAFKRTLEAYPPPRPHDERTGAEDG